MDNFEQNQNKEFSSFYEEMIYEFKDVMELLSYIFGKDKKADNDYIDLLLMYSERPANDNWPIYDTETKKRNDEYAV